MKVFEKCPICDSTEEDWQCLNLSVFCSPECKALYRRSGGMVAAARDSIAKERIFNAAQVKFTQKINGKNLNEEMKCQFQKHKRSKS